VTVSARAIGSVSAGGSIADCSAGNKKNRAEIPAAISAATITIGADENRDFSADFFDFTAFTAFGAVRSQSFLSAGTGFSDTLIWGSAGGSGGLAAPKVFVLLR
jgi:hypothetical protein